MNKKSETKQGKKFPNELLPDILRDDAWLEKTFQLLGQCL